MDILSLPTEIICEIGMNIELPVDIARFSLACRDFYACRNIHLLNWLAKLRGIIKEINSIEYIIANSFEGICDGYDDLKPKSYRKRDGIVTHSYIAPDIHLRYPTLRLGKNNDILRVRQSFPTNKINEHRKQRLAGRDDNYSTRFAFDMKADKCVYVDIIHDDFSYQRPIFSEPILCRVQIIGLYH